MPYGDGSGPGGMGARTGRGFGYCSGFNHPGYVMGRGFGRGMGRRFGRGFSAWNTDSGPFWGSDFPQTYNYSPDQEKEYLKNQVSVMEKTIEDLKNRMSEIDKKK